MRREGSSSSIPLAILALVAIGYVLYAGKAILAPLLVAFLLCKVCQPAISALERRKVPWQVTVGLIMAALVLVLSLVGSALYDNARAFLATLDQPLAPSAGAVPGAEPAPVTFESFLAVLDAGFKDAGGAFDRGRIMQLVKDAVPRLAGLFASTLLALLDLANQVLLVLFFMLFIFAEQKVARRKLLLAAGARRSEVERVLQAVDHDVNRYLLVKTAISLATATCCFLGLLLIGVPYATLFALLTFLLDYIPNFGSILAALFPLVAAWIDTGGWLSPLLVLGVYLTVNVVFGNVVEPRILGRQLDLSPLVLLVAVLFWSALWGVTGMFLAVPLTRTVQLVFANVPSMKGIAVLMSSGEGEATPSHR